jgi:RimJ/RimL family protein N-acetyltransferase
VTENVTNRTGLVPVRQGRHVSLFGLHPSLYGPLHAELTVPEVTQAWRSRGRFVPSYELERFLTQGIHRSAVAALRTDPRHILGLLELLDYQPLERRGEISIATTLKFQGSGLMLEAAALFLDDCFASLRLEKIYSHLAEDSHVRLSSAFTEALSVEGTLRDYLFVGGRLQDVTIASLTRAQFALLVGDPALAGYSENGWRVLSEYSP